VDWFPSGEQIKGDLAPNYYYLSKYTVDEGYDVHIVCGRKAGEKKYEEIDGIKIHRVAKINNRRSYLYGDFAKESFKKIKEIKPDIIHGHTTIHFACVWNKEKIGNTMVLTHFHSALDSYKHIDYLPIFFNIKEALAYRFAMWSYFHENKLVLKKSNYIIAVSRTSAKSIKSYIPEARISVIYNGFDPKLFRRVESDIKERLNADYLLLYVGRPMPGKGIQYLLRAIPELNKRFNGLKVLLLGVEREDSKIFCEWLRSIAKKLELNNVVFSKGVPQKEMPKYYSAADCFVLPTLSEGLSKVLLEAQACSCPVVATNIGSNREIVSKKGGLLCKPRSVEDLREKITFVLENKRKFDGRKSVGRFTWNRCAEKIIDLYRNLVS